MKVKELRVGNWWTNGSYDYVMDINTLYDIYIAEEIGNSHMWEPIPFTRDWLIKLNLSEEFLLQDCKIEIFQHFADDTIWFFNIDNSLVLEFKNVHELQNLYYVLSGEELTIKE